MAVQKGVQRLVVKGLVVVFVVESICLAVVYRKWSHTQADLDEMRVTAKIERVINALQIPSEALYCDYDARRKITAIRWETFARLGVDEFLPYSNINPLFCSVMLDEPGLELGKVPITMIPTGEGQDYSTYYRLSLPPVTRDSVDFLEQRWPIRVSRALDGLRGALKSKSDIHDYLDTHPGYLERVFQPWLERITKGTLAYPALVASEILLSQGQGVETAKSALARILQYRDFPDKTGALMCRERAVALVREYNLDIPIDPNTADGG